MSRKLSILVWLTALILFSAKRCAEELTATSRLNEAAWREAKDSLEKVFSSNLLDKQELAAFERKAMQKLQDYADYLRIATNDSLPPEFRTQADTMVAGLFRDYSPPKIVSKGKYEILIDSLRVLVPFHQTGPEEYRGRLTFLLHRVGPSCNNLPTGKKEYKEIDIFALKVRIRVAQDTLTVWRILLGRIF